MPKVSVIIPVYNTEKYLRRCLESVCNQTLKDIEIICINDCSTDDSLSLLQEFAKNDTRVKVIDFTENRGVSVARNTGIDTAQGEYIGFVDSDDFIDLDFYEKLYAKAIQTQSDMVKGERVQITEEGKKIKSDLNSLISKTNRFSFSYEFTTSIYKLNFIKKYNIHFPENIKNNEDIQFLMKSLLYTNDLRLVNDVNYYYFRRPNSANVPHLSIEKIEGVWLTFENMLDDLNNSKFSNNIESYAQLFTQFFGGCLFQVTKNKNHTCASLCVEKVFLLFEKCLHKEQVLSKFSILHPNWENYLRTKDKDSFVNYLLDKQSQHKNVASFLRKKFLENKSGL